MSQGIAARASGSGLSLPRCFDSQQPGDFPARPGSAERGFGMAPRAEDSSRAGTVRRMTGTSCPRPAQRGRIQAHSLLAAAFGSWLWAVFVQRINRALVYGWRLRLRRMLHPWQEWALCCTPSPWHPTGDLTQSQGKAH